MDTITIAVILYILNKQARKGSTVGARVPRVLFYPIQIIPYTHPISRKYKFLNEKVLYFVSMVTVNGIDLFVLDEYSSIIVDSLDHCRKEKG